MIFKQGILKEEKKKFLGSIIAVLIVPLAILIIIIIKQDNLKLFLFFSLILIFPIFIILTIFELKNLEWFIIYKEKIEVRCIFGIKNIVYFKDVLFIEKIEINLTSRGTPKYFLVFNDGRKNNDSFFGFNSCYNKKKFNLRIYNTERLEKFIKSTLKIKVISECNE